MSKTFVSLLSGHASYVDIRPCVMLRISALMART